MSDASSRPATVLTDGAPGFSHAAWGWITLWAGSATVLGFAAAAVDPIGELGPAAVVFAGAGAGAATLALGKSMRGAAKAVAARRGAKEPPLPGPRPAASASVPAAAAAFPAADPVLLELVSGLAAQIARLEAKLATVTKGGAAPPAAREEGEPRGADALALTVEALHREQRAIRAEATSAERRLTAGVEGMSQELARLRGAVAENDARSRDFEGQIFDILRARDAATTLRDLDAEASDLFDSLFYGDERRYATAEAWQADYAEWRTHINGFWDIVRGYRTSVEQPFAVSEADIEHAGGIPDTALFATADMRFRYKMLVLMNERHVNFREGAFSFNARKCSLPEPGRRAPPPVGRHRAPADGLAAAD